MPDIFIYMNKLNMNAKVISKANCTTYFYQKKILLEGHVIGMHHCP
jgi:hypothetical protein